MKCGNEDEMEEIIKALDAMGGTPIDRIAEDVIFLDYERTQILPPFIFPSIGPDKTSVFRDDPGDNVGQMIAFLKTMHPACDAVALHIMSNMAGAGVKVPDWITHRPSQSTFEFYEVKPASKTGKRKGVEKIVRCIATFGSDPALRQYTPGVHYSRRGSSPALTILKGVMQTEVEIRWEPGSVPGLIVYTICSETKLRGTKISTEGVKALFMAALMLMAIAAAAVGESVFG